MVEKEVLERLDTSTEQWTSKRRWTELSMNAFPEEFSTAQRKILGRETGDGILAKDFAGKDCDAAKKTLILLQQGESHVDPSEGALQTDELTDVRHIDSDSENVHERDTFKCGRCKTQFQSLPAFIDHKRTRCETTDQKTERMLVSDATLPNDGKLFLENFAADESPEDPGILSFVVETNQVLIANPVEGNEAEKCRSGEADGGAILELQCDNPTKNDKTDRSKTKLPCSYCGKVFEKPFNLQQHERVHTGERPFQCVICGRAFSQKANVRKHMMRHKVWPQAKQTLRINVNPSSLTDGTSYSCQYCSLSFSSYSLHKKHLSVHSDFKVYRCIQKGCDETFNDLDEFLSHSESHSSAEFQCHVCLKIFTSLEELGVHQYDHDLPSRVKKDFNIKLKCEICHAQFKSAESLKNHLAVDSHNYECPRCPSVFSCERFLRRHLSTHTDPSQSRFECESCSKTFRTQKYLNNHRFIHSSEKPFNCELCGKQFASKYRLKRHLAIHLSQYLECPFKAHLGCEKKFYRKDKLRNHVSTHCHFKARSCHACSKTFSSSAKLEQHVKREHRTTGKRKQVLECASCSQTFRKQKQLLQHHCTVGDRKGFKARKRSDAGAGDGVATDVEVVSNIEIIMVPYVNALSHDVD